MGDIAVESIFEISGWDSLAIRCEETVLKAVIEKKIKKYNIYNVQNAMKNLSGIGQQLQLAFGRSKGYPCSTYILKVLSRYQDLIKELSHTSITFVEAALKALKYHKFALEFIDRDKVDEAFKMIQKCADLAESMVTETNVLVESSEEICKLSNTSMSETQKNRDDIEVKEQKQKDKQLEDKQLEELDQELQILKQKDKEEEAELLHKQARDVTVTCFSFLFGRIAPEEHPEGVNKCKEKEKRIAEIQHAQRDSNLKSESAILQIKNLGQEKETLRNVEQSLVMVSKTLSEVKTVFVNAQRFWEVVQKESQSLTEKWNNVVDNDHSDKVLFSEEVKESGYVWLALGKINFQVVDGITGVDGDIDNIMENLPTKEVAKETMKDLNTRKVPGSQY